MIIIFPLIYSDIYYFVVISRISLKILVVLKGDFKGLGVQMMPRCSAGLDYMYLALFICWRTERLLIAWSVNPGHLSSSLDYCSLCRS